MILKSLEIANFRKFRDPLRIGAFTDGLNIVVEPNETGKSTLLEALRAAFFIRHSARTELVRSYVPIGDDVAPRMCVEFMVEGQSWSLEKQFIRSPFVRLSGIDGRHENDAAEQALQEGEVLRSNLLHVQLAAVLGRIDIATRTGSKGG